MNKVIIPLVVFACVLSATYLLFKPQPETFIERSQQLFKQWKQTYHPLYMNQEEEQYRQQIFSENLNRIELHNSDKSQTYKKGLNQFSDMTKEEFKQRILIKGTPTNPPTTNKAPLTAYPASINWAQKGAVTPVKDQGQCGSCWAFSTTGMLEGVNQLRNQSLLSFSEQQLVDCVTTSAGCDGGWPYLAVEYVEQTGILQESQYSYTATSGACQVTGKTQGFFVSNYVSVVQSVDGLKSALAVQPVSIAVDASTWFDYSSGVFSDCSSDPQSVDHAVLAVGYDANRWIVKNSWNTSWGDQGYISLALGNTCGLFNYAIISSI